MRIELDRRRNQILFVSLSLALAGTFLFKVQNHYRASRYAADISQPSLEAAVRLEPGSAEYHDLLGRLYLYSLQDPAEAGKQLREAVDADPNTSRYWLDLAAAEGMLGQVDRQRAALRSALKVDPKTPKVAWEAGNFFLMDGNVEPALDSFKTVLEYDPLSLHPAVDLSWRATHDVQMVLAHAMPRKLDPHLELIRILIAQDRLQDAMTVWRALVQIDTPKISDAMPFVEHFIHKRDIPDAQEIWSAMAKNSASLRPSSGEGNLIVNGDFDEEIVPGGFSWRLQPPASQSTRIDTQEIHGGTSSVSFDFAGPSFGDYGFSQLVPVKPKQNYDLQVSAKCQEITSAEGPRLMVEDAFTHAPLAIGQEWQGTHGWDEQHILFSTKPETQLVRIFVGRTGPGLIRGKLWLDNIRMFER